MRRGPRVLVVGGGITGLSAAYLLRRDAPGLDVTVVEAAERLGGKVRTEHVDGFVVEAGPESLLSGKPQGVRLAAELGVRLVPVQAGRPAVLVNGRLRQIPLDMAGFVPRRVWPMVTSRLLSPSAKCRMAMEWAVPARVIDDDESLESFASRRLGRQAFQRLVAPVASGVFSADPARLSVLATMPQLRAAERAHGGLLRAMLAERRAAPRPGRHGTAPAGALAPERGMSSLVDALADHLTGVDLRLGTSVVSVSRAAGGYDVRLRSRDGRTSTVTVEALVLAVPAGVAAALLQGLVPGGLTDELQAVPDASTVTVSLGFRTVDVPQLAQRLGGYGYLVAGRLDRLTRACTHSSAKLPGRAPAGHELVRVSMGGPGRPPVDDLSDRELVGEARAELADVLGITAPPVLSRVHRWSGVMPQYAVGHVDRVRRVEQALGANPGVVLAGSAFHGLGIPDCIASAERAADAVRAQLTTRQVRGDRLSGDLVVDGAAAP